MTDLATLGLEIRSDGVVVAKDRLKDFEGQAGKTVKATDLLVRAMGLLGAAFSVTKLIQYTNVWTDLRSRVNLAAGSLENGAAVMGRLTQMARLTYSGLEDTAESYLRNASSMRELGYSTSQTIDYVEAINNALVVSGSKGQQAESVMTALGKAMALGKLSGENLNTVLASGDRIATALGDKLGATRGELLALGSQGKITGDVIYEALTSQMITLREEAGGMAATIGDAFVIFNNSALSTVGAIDQWTGASGRVAEAIIWVADNFELLGKIGALVAVAKLGWFGPALVASIGTVAAAIGIGMVGAVKALTAAMMANPLGVLIAGIGLVITAAYLFRDEIKEVFGIDVVAITKGAANNIIGLMAGAYNAVVTAWGLLPAAFADIFTRAMNGSIDIVQNGVNAIAGALRNIPGLGGIGDVDLSGYKREESGASTDFGGKVQSAFQEGFSKDYLGEISAALEGVFGTAEGANAAIADLTTTVGGGGGAGGAGGGAADAFSKMTKSVNDNIAALTLEAETLGMTEFQATKLATAQELLRAAAEAGRPITAGLIEDINGLAYKYAEAEQIVAGVQLTIGNPDPWQVMREELASLDAALAAGAISWDQYHAAAARSMASAAGSTIDSIGQITSVLAGAFEDNKALAVANAVVSTAGGVMKALEQGGMFGWPMAAAIAAAGAMQIGTIMSASPGGGSAGSVRAPAAPTIQNGAQRAPAEKSPDRTDVYLHGLDRNAMYSGENIERIIGLIEERSGDGRILNIKVA